MATIGIVLTAAEESGCLLQIIKSLTFLASECTQGKLVQEIMFILLICVTIYLSRDVLFEYLRAVDTLCWADRPVRSLPSL